VHGTAKNHILLGRLIAGFIRAGWNPPVPSSRIAHRILDDMADPKFERAGESATNRSFSPTLDLQPKERAALALAAHGLNTETIAEALGVSPDTAKSNLKRARDRLSARNTAHAVALAIRDGLIDMGEHVEESRTPRRAA
jgi:DNA-binding CsgD family transcriptional regulator